MLLTCAPRPFCMVCNLSARASTCRLLHGRLTGAERYQPSPLRIGRDCCCPRSLTSRQHSTLCTKTMPRKFSVIVWLHTRANSHQSPTSADVCHVVAVNQPRPLPLHLLSMLWHARGCRARPNVPRISPLRHHLLVRSGDALSRKPPSVDIGMS